MTVYRLKFLAEDFQCLMAKDRTAMVNFPFDGTAVGNSWKAPELRIAQPKWKRPLIWSYSPVPAVFAVAEADLIGRPLLNVLEENCEILKATVGDQRFRFANVTNVVDALNKGKSEFNKDVPGLLDRYSFRPRRLGTSLFKLPETGASEILIVEGIAAPGDEFKGIVEREKLAGVGFEKLWSDED